MLEERTKWWGVWCSKCQSLDSQGCVVEDEIGEDCKLFDEIAAFNRQPKEERTCSCGGVMTMRPAQMA